MSGLQLLLAGWLILCVVFVLYVSTLAWHARRSYRRMVRELRRIEQADPQAEEWPWVQAPMISREPLT